MNHELIELLNEFLDESAWKRSKKGNLTREWDGYRVTIFGREGGYRWVIGRDDDPDEPARFSKTLYEDEEDAQEGAADELIFF